MHPGLGSRTGCVVSVYYLLYLLKFLHRRKKLLDSYIGSPKGTKPPIFKKFIKGGAKKLVHPKFDLTSKCNNSGIIPLKIRMFSSTAGNLNSNALGLLKVLL